MLQDWNKIQQKHLRSCLPLDHLLLDSAPNLGPLISHWEINKFENCWYKSARILEVLQLLFRQFLNLWNSQWDMSGPILGALSNNRWSRGINQDGSFICSLLEQLFRTRSNGCPVFQVLLGWFIRRHYQILPPTYLLLFCFLTSRWYSDRSASSVRLT